MVIYVLVIIVIIGGVILVLKYTGNKVDLNNVEVIKLQVSRHIVLPKDEQPALATITNHDRLTGAFLKKTENGDKLLIYQTNKEVFIYRPSIDRLIGVGPVIDSTAAQSTQ